jgi:fatty-acyl-CoA synthase
MTPRAPFSRTIPDLIAERASANHSAPAAISGDIVTSYGDLHAMATRLAGGLHRIGVRRGDTIGIICTNRVEWLVTMVAAGQLGAKLAAFDTWSRRWDLEFLLEHSRVSVIVTLEAFHGHRYVDDIGGLVPEIAKLPAGQWHSDRFPHLRDVVVIGSTPPPGMWSFDELVSGSELDCLPPGDAASALDTALIVYTSGSTARPKGVPLIHAATIENAFNIGERMGLTAADRVWIAVPLFWSYGSVNAAMAALTHGAALVLQEQFEPGEAIELIERYACTTVYLLPNLTAALIDHESFDPSRLSSLRTGIMIGASEDLRRAAQILGVVDICNVYGSTETYGNCVVTPSSMPLADRLISQGLPLPGTTVRIVDPATGVDRPAGEVGEVWVSGYVTRGYLDNSDLNARTFTPDGFYRTGDLATFDEKGYFHFVARSSEMIKTGGINVSPIEVESFLLSHPAVRSSAVVGVPDPTRGQVVVAFVELTAGSTQSSGELRSYCKDGMAGYKVPARILIWPELPRTDTGKVDRRRIGELALESCSAGRS